MLFDPTPTAGITNSLIAWTRHDVQNGGSFCCHKNDRLNEEVKSNAWIIPGIKTVRHCIRVLYLISRNSNDPKLKSYYKLFCRNLINVIKETKIANYKREILNSDNKMKTTWNIIKSEIGRKVKNKNIH